MDPEKILRKAAGEMKLPGVDESALNAAVRTAKEAFWSGEETRVLSWPAFLYQQMAYINKIWWILQAASLVLLWIMLKTAGSASYEERCLGIMAPLFIILILPELWKNVSSHSLEIEGATLYSLRKVVAARMLVFGMVDLVLLSLFVSVGVSSTRISLFEMLTQFLLPMMVTVCICLRLFSGQRFRGVLPSFAACLVWITVWLLLVLREDVYAKISMPVWFALLILSVSYMGYCVHRIMRNSEKTMTADLQGDM